MLCFRLFSLTLMLTLLPDVQPDATNDDIPTSNTDRVVHVSDQQQDVIITKNANDGDTFIIKNNNIEGDEQQDHRKLTGRDDGPTRVSITREVPPRGSVSVRVSDTNPALRRCCGRDVFGNEPVMANGAELQEIISKYVFSPSSVGQYGYPMNCWDMSNVVDMTEAFYRQTSFNEPINCWNTSNVVTMRSMFREARAFNGDLSSWVVSRVRDMSYIFKNAVSFNGDIRGWDVTYVRSMSSVFSGAESFNIDLSYWKPNSATDMRYMFDGAKLFNADISRWDTSNVRYMQGMFYGALAFNVDVGNWNVENVNSISWMFYKAESFNRDISSWNIRNVESMSKLFEDAVNFCQDLCSWSNKDINLLFSNEVFTNSNCPVQEQVVRSQGPYCFFCSY